MERERDAYEVLRVRPDSSLQAISAAYRSLAHRYHPDQPTGDPVRMIEVNRAYNELKTAERRRRYDAARARAAARSVRPAQTRPYTFTSAAQQPSAPPPAATSSGPSSPAWTRVSGAVSTVLDFGRYAGWRIADLAKHDPEYLRWLSRHSAGIRFRNEISRCLPGDREVGRRSSVFA